jgi:hypothetical protein
MSSYSITASHSYVTAVDMCDYTANSLSCDTTAEENIWSLSRCHLFKVKLEGKGYSWPKDIKPKHVHL